MQKFMLSLPHDLHRKVKILSVLKGISMNEFVVMAVREKLDKIDENETMKGVK